MRKLRTHRLTSAILLCLAMPALGPIACTTAATNVAPAGKSLGIAREWMDTSAKPGDDFYAYASGKWAQEIPADRGEVNAFWLTQQRTDRNTDILLRDLLAGEPRPGSNEDLIKTFYQAYMDTAAIEAADLAPIRPDLDRFAAVCDKTQLAQVLGSQLRADVDPLNLYDLRSENLFGVYVTQALKGGEVVPYLLQGGLGLPDREYYLSADPHMAELRDGYRAYIEAIFAAARMDEPAARAQRVFDLETKLARAHETLAESDDWTSAAELWTPEMLAAKAPGLDWKAFLDAAGMGRVARFDAYNSDAIPRIAALVASEPLDAWKDWLAFHQINQNTTVLPARFDDLRFGFFSTAMSGQTVQRPRAARALSAINANLGDALGQLYVERYFKPESKAEVHRMVDQVKAAFVRRLDGIDWLDDATREEAKRKVATMEVGTGYPDTWRSFAGVSLDPQAAYANKQALERHYYRQQLGKIGKPLDRREWWMNAQLVNAVNLPVQNALNFPAAIMQPPFYDPQADPAANYAGIGATIGHELSHSFDSLGAEFDSTGAMRDWWTARDRAEFEKAGQALAAQFDTYEALPGVSVRGEQTLAENIADVAGLAAAYDAYRASLGGKEAPVIDGLTGDQRFFIAFAQSWATKMREEVLRQRVSTDAHAPGMFRALTVRNLDAWYDAFDVKPGDKLYLPPEKRITVW
ncbi:M13 family metallopeptidase [Tsuneonella sp. HG222]